MEREKLGEFMSAYLEGELDERRRRSVEQMLREDAAARQALEEMRAAMNTLASLPRQAAPASVLEEIHARLERAELLGDAGEAINPAVGRRWRVWGLTAMAASFMLVVMAGIWITSRQMSQRGDQTASSTKPSSMIETDAINAELRRGTAGPMEAPESVNTGNLEAKLALGARQADIEHHSFDAEAMRLRVELKDDVQQKNAVRAIENRLLQAGVANLRDEKGGRDKIVSASQRFYLPGRSNTNFAQNDKEQILVRLPAEEAELLFVAFNEARVPPEQVELQAGSLRFPGLSNARETLRNQSVVAGRAIAMGNARRDNVRPADGERDADFRASGEETADRDSVTGAVHSGSGPIPELLRLMGVDPAVFQSLAKEKTPEPGNGAVLAFGSGGYARRDEVFGPPTPHEEEGMLEGKVAAATLPISGSGSVSRSAMDSASIVERNLRKLESVAKKDAVGRVTSPDDDSRNDEISVYSERYAKQIEPLVTLVIELEVKPNAAAAPIKPVGRIGPQGPQDPKNSHLKR